MTYILLKKKPPKAMVLFENLKDALEIRKILDDKYGNGVYLTIEEKEAYSIFPELAKKQH